MRHYIRLAELGIFTELYVAGFKTINNGGEEELRCLQIALCAKGAFLNAYGAFLCKIWQNY